jgi:hypothetical protein
VRAPEGLTDRTDDHQQLDPWHSPRVFFCAVAEHPGSAGDNRHPAHQSARRRVLAVEPDRKDGRSPPLVLGHPGWSN